MYCPVCEKEVEKWLVFSSRPNVACPHCSSAERHRFTALYLKNNKKIYNNFLHIAPEKTLQNIFKQNSNNYICGDLNPNRYANLNAIYLDATNISFKNDYFDCIYASHILEHIIEDRKAMSEMYRVLKNDGVLLAIVPQRMDLDKTYEDSTITTAADRKRVFGQWDHVRYYGVDFSARLKECGFYIKIYHIEGREKCVEKMIYDEKHLIECDRSKYNLPSCDLLYVCVKPSDNK